jgi:hypothetical protein
VKTVNEQSSFGDVSLITWLAPAQTRGNPRPRWVKGHSCSLQLREQHPKWEGRAKKRPADRQALSAEVQALGSCSFTFGFGLNLGEILLCASRFLFHRKLLFDLDGNSVCIDHVCRRSGEPESHFYRVTACRIVISTSRPTRALSSARRSGASFTCAWPRSFRFLVALVLIPNPQRPGHTVTSERDHVSFLGSRIRAVPAGLAGVRDGRNHTPHFR